jgi:hypothetical protein
MAVTGLPHDPLTPLDPNTTPTPTAVRRLRQEMYNNALSMQTTYGGGQHGHLGMLMPYHRYQVLAKTPYSLSDSAPAFVDPHEQAAARQVWWKPWTWTQSTAATTKLYNDAKLKFDKATTNWEAAHEFKRTMRKLLIQAVPAMYLTTFHSSEYGYADMEPGAVLEQLIHKYGTITRKEMAANLAKMRLPWNPDAPIETVFTNAEECQKFATDGDEPIPEGQYIEALEETFRNSGVLEQAVYAWETMSEEDQTLELMREHFTKADIVRRSKRDTIRGTLTANLAGATPVTPSPPPTKPARQYCWTHGFGNHSGTNCRSPAKGHVREATMDNWEDHGGSSTLVPLKGKGTKRKHRDQDFEKRQKRKREEETTKAVAKALAAIEAAKHKEE